MCKTTKNKTKTLGRHMAFVLVPIIVLDSWKRICAWRSVKWVSGSGCTRRARLLDWATGTHRTES
jgi:hypothetical protein